MSIEVHFDSHKFKNWLSAIERRQLPYATALAMSRTGYDIRDAIRKNVSKKFTLRNTWTLKGIASTKADKNAYPKIEVEVGSRDWYMAGHETGETRKPKKARNFAIPKGVRAEKRQRITPAKRPRALLGKDKYFIKPLRRNNRNGAAGIFLRKKKGLKLMYTLSPKPTTLPKREFVEKTAKALAPKLMPIQFKRAMEQAVRTAR